MSFDCHIVQTSHFIDFLITPGSHQHTAQCFAKPTKPVCMSAGFPWVMTELTISKPAECQFHQTYRGPGLKSKHKIKQETIDGPAETQAAPLTISCHHLLGCQNNGIAPLSICMHSLISSWFLYFVCVLLSAPVQLTEHVGIYRRQVTPKLFPALWDLSEKSLTSVLKYQIQCQLGRMLLWLALCCSNDRGSVIQLNRFRSKYYNWGKVM